MEPMNYGEMVAAHMADLRRDAKRVRAARPSGRIAAWRRVGGRMLVAVGERLEGSHRQPEVEPPARGTLLG